MIELLLVVDYTILRFFNVDMGSPAMDRFWAFLSHSDRYPLFIFVFVPALLIWMFSIYRQATFKILVALALTVGLCDALNYRILKHMVERPRPFQNSEISGWLRHAGEAQGSSFPSSHAANCFAGAVILSYYVERRRYLFYIFAALVALSRVSLGVHYPSDVIAGAIFGFFVGFLVKTLILSRFDSLRAEQIDLPVKKESDGWRTRTRRLEDV